MLSDMEEFGERAWLLHAPPRPAGKNSGTSDPWGKKPQTVSAAPLTAGKPPQLKGDITIISVCKMCSLARRHTPTVSWQKQRLTAGRNWTTIFVPFYNLETPHPIPAGFWLQFLLLWNDATALWLSFWPLTLPMTIDQTVTKFRKTIFLKWLNGFKWFNI